MPGMCPKSTFTGRHEWAVVNDKDEQGKSYEAVRCFFCHAPAPAEEAARALAVRDDVREYARIQEQRKKTDDKRRAAANREAMKKAAERLV